MFYGRKFTTNLDSDKVEAAFRSYSLGDHGFGAARRAVHQQAFRWVDAQSGEGVRMGEGPDHSLLQLQLQLFLTPYI